MFDANNFLKPEDYKDAEEIFSNEKVIGVSFTNSEYCDVEQGTFNERWVIAPKNPSAPREIKHVQIFEFKDNISGHRIIGLSESIVYFALEQ